MAVQDIRPLPPGDPGGVSALYFTIGVLVPRLAFAALRRGRTRTRPARPS
jgi:hypothetical protein